MSSVAHSTATQKSLHQPGFLKPTVFCFWVIATAGGCGQPLNELDAAGAQELCEDSVDILLEMIEVTTPKFCELEFLGEDDEASCRELADECVVEIESDQDLADDFIAECEDAEIDVSDECTATTDEYLRCARDQLDAAKKQLKSWPGCSDAGKLEDFDPADLEDENPESCQEFLAKCPDFVPPDAALGRLRIAAFRQVPVRGLRVRSW